MLAEKRVGSFDSRKHFSRPLDLYIVLSWYPMRAPPRLNEGYGTWSKYKLFIYKKSNIAAKIANGASKPAVQHESTKEIQPACPASPLRQPGLHPGSDALACLPGLSRRAGELSA